MEEARLVPQNKRLSPKKTSVLECRVCEEVFGLHGDKIPRLLFCGHTLCHACLSRLPTAQGFISCPFDRQQTLMGNNGVWELKKNFALIELIERIQNQENSQAFSSTFLEKERELSVPCDEVEDHLAVLYCTVCGTHLCEQCAEQSHATRMLAKHRRIPLSEKPREKPVCPYHTSHVMEFTCLQEECSSAPLMCYICKDYGRHKGHQHNLLELEAESLRSRMAASVQKMKKFMEEMSETNRTLEQVADACIQCDRLARQDDARVLLACQEISLLLESVESQQQQFSDFCPDQLNLDPAIPITFTKDNRVHIGPKIEMRVVTLGLDGAGKTTILCKLKQGEFVVTIPTIGFNVETLEFKNVKITLWDVGGQHKLRPLWKHYYLNTQAVIFVLDAFNRERLQESRTELVKLLSEKELKDAALLILANKQDMTGCCTIEEIADSFSLYKLCCGRSWHIQACDAKSGLGLQDGLDWLCKQLVAAGLQDLG